ncbi:hypothetical protein BFJ69_g17810 [Fusarium oxysporum]|uniref:Uncharacterized protein n=1 Tax=Fusarium oxysporum TaxID=5507 RepID=A0A420M770_FUSOX|nr:hypothetical protein BFJ69_g17810 [Fusarium oxysporum]
MAFRNMAFRNTAFRNTAFRNTAFRNTACCREQSSDERPNEGFAATCAWS